MRGDQIGRQLKLIGLLSGRLGRTLDQLAGEFGVTKRTIQRDIAVLETSFPVVSELRDGSVYWRLVDQTRSGELVFTLSELMALYFSRDLLRLLQGSPMQEALDTAIEKIGAKLPACSHDILRRLKEQTSVSVTGWKDYSQSSEAIRAINRAIRYRLTVRLSHKPLKSSEHKTRTVDPYRLWYAGGGLYLVAYDHAKQDIRTFAVERIQRVASTNQRFTVREDFDFDAFTRTAFPVHGGEPQQVRIRFSAEQAPYITERHWHDSQKFLPQEDGSVVMELQVGSLWEVKRWLIGWGADAEVVEPRSLKRQIESECKRMVGVSPQDKSISN
jgi:predicted DNA-binding transcriptional regulator YafY